MCALIAGLQAEGTSAFSLVEKEFTPPRPAKKGFDEDKKTTKILNPDGTTTTHMDQGALWT